jgi:hypothetical protein
MPPDSDRSAEQIREELRQERARLDSAVGALGAGAKYSGKVAGSALGSLGALLLVARRLRKRRSRS